MQSTFLLLCFVISLCLAKVVNLKGKDVEKVKTNRASKHISIIPLDIGFRNLFPPSVSKLPFHLMPRHSPPVGDVGSSTDDGNGNSEDFMFEALIEITKLSINTLQRVITSMQEIIDNGGVSGGEDNGNDEDGNGGDSIGTSNGNGGEGNENENGSGVGNENGGDGNEGGEGGGYASLLRSTDSSEDFVKLAETIHRKLSFLMEWLKIMETTLKELRIQKDMVDVVECPAPFTEEGGMCLHTGPYSDSYDFSKARMYCQYNGGDLATFADANEFASAIKFLNNVDQQQEHSYWIGGTDAKSEGQWQWIDGRAMPRGKPFWAHRDDGTFTSTNALEPSGNQDQNYAFMKKETFWMMHDVDFDASDYTEGAIVPLCRYEPNYRYPLGSHQYPGVGANSLYPGASGGNGLSFAHMMELVQSHGYTD